MQQAFTELRIFTFDGRVFEVFETEGGSTRYHATYIKNIVLQDRGWKGYRISFDYGSTNYPIRIGIANEDVAAVSSLVSAIAIVSG